MSGAAADGFPWQRLMNWGLRELRLPPHEFWRSTLRELVPASRFPPGTLHGAELRQKLDDMMKDWPDA